MQKGHYTINLEDGTKIPIRFTTWGFRRLSEEKGQSVDEFEKTLKGGLLTTEDLVRLIYYAALWVANSQKKDFTYTEFDVWNWIDGVGGTRSPQLIEMGQILVAVYFGIEVDDVKKAFEIQLQNMKDEAAKSQTVEVIEPDEEKKSPEKLNGGRYIRQHVKQD